jgi:hypothetical protein
MGDGSRVASWSGLGVEIIDARSGEILRTVEMEGREDNEMVLSPDGSRVAAGVNYRLGVWDIELAPLQSDRSDSLWAIVATRIAAVDVDFGKQVVGSGRDSVVEGFIRNTGSVAARIEEITLSGAARADFALISGAPPYTIGPGESRAVEFRFEPKRAGKRTAQIDIRSGGSKLAQTISGEGVVPRLAIEPELVDFGTIPVGYRKDTTITTLLKNEGSEPIEILGVVQLGPDTTQFSVLVGGGRFTLPLPDDWMGIRGKMYGAYSIGVKGGLQVIDELNVAAGYQWGRSIFDDEITPDTVESRITANALYGSVSYGDDHRRASITFGYADKTHRRIPGVFDTTSAFVAIGGDWQFAPRWKICAEMLTMKTLGFIPVAASARWFGREWALDVGAAYVGLATDGGDAPEIPVVPVVSYVMIF